MSVFTPIKQPQLEAFLERYDIGRLRAFAPIAAGITNTNYTVDTEGGAFVLTLYEHHSDDELYYMLGLQRHLAARSVACAAPVGDRRGDFFSTLNQRPAAIITRLPGEVQPQPGIAHCAAVGAELARFHSAGMDFAARRINPRGADWVFAVSDMLDAELDDSDRLLIASTLREYRGLDFESLPAGAVHADLFHDNVLFDGERLCGICDFDYACHDSLVLDIAIVLHDWCRGASGELDEARGGALLGAYRHERELSRPEISALSAMLRFTALRFWLSRHYDRLFPLPGELTYSKDPDEYRRLLLMCRDDGEILQQFLARFLEPA
ncbi:MAG TPA: homoserine kinase [Gammaproteobacteria bacterium]|jgi:homoserine kinase type II